MQRIIVKSENRDNALEIVESKDRYEHPYSKKGESRITKSTNRRPKSFRSGSKNSKGILFHLFYLSFFDEYKYKSS